VADTQHEALATMRNCLLARLPHSG
jgi:hypothetical protein